MPRELDIIDLFPVDLSGGAGTVGALRDLYTVPTGVVAAEVYAVGIAFNHVGTFGAARWRVLVEETVPRAYNTQTVAAPVGDAIFTADHPAMSFVPLGSIENPIPVWIPLTDGSLLRIEFTTIGQAVAHVHIATCAVRVRVRELA